MNDSHILLGIVSVFILLGFFLPYINEAFGQDSTSQNFNNLQNELGEATSENGVNAFTVLASILSMFFWSFGLPAWLNAIFLIPRLMIVWLIVRLVRGVG